MPSVLLWAYSAEELFLISQIWKICGFSRFAFSREGFGTNSLSQNLTVLPAPSERELFEVEVKFLVAFDTLALELTACALSVKAYGFDSSPKGRAKSTARNFLIAPNTLATSLRPWLSL